LISVSALFALTLHQYTLRAPTYTGRLFYYGILNQQLALIGRMVDEIRYVGAAPPFFKVRYYRNFRLKKL